MAVSRLILLGLAFAALTLASALPLDTSPNDVNDKAKNTTKSPQNWTKVTVMPHMMESDYNDVSDDDDDYDHNGLLFDLDSETELYGIPLKYLTANEIASLLEEDDNMVIADLDIFVTKRMVKERQAGNWEPAHRHKRAGLVPRGVSAAARGLFKGSTFTGTTRSGTRITRHFDRIGNFGAASDIFDHLNPAGEKTFTGRISGRTGVIGPHRVTVRNGSKHGAPTMEIISPRTGGTTVRKFRFIDPTGLDLS